jgi:hypothetical protein
MRSKFRGWLSRKREGYNHSQLRLNQMQKPRFFVRLMKAKRGHHMIKILFVFGGGFKIAKEKRELETSNKMYKRIRKSS